MKKIISILSATLMITAALAGCTTQTSNSSETEKQPAPSVSANEPTVSTTDTTFDMEMPISVITREEGSGTRGAFIELFGILKKGEDGTKTDQTTKEAINANKTDVMLQNVAGNEYAIGYVSLGSLNQSVKALQIDGVDASAEKIKSGEYKVSRPFNIATKGEPTGLAKDFISFIMSEQGQQIVEESGYIKAANEAVAFEGENPQGKLVIAGSSSVSPVMEKLVEAYKKINTGATIEIQTNDSTAGMTAAMEGTCDIGMASRALKESETAQLTGLAIANDGIAVIVAPQNPMSNLTAEQVHDIFTGKTIEWSELS